MIERVLEATKLMEDLPVKNQELALQMIKKIVLAWDPYYTKSTKREREILDKAEKEYENGDIVDDSEEIWN